MLASPAGTAIQVRDAGAPGPPIGLGAARVETRTAMNGRGDAADAWYRDGVLEARVAEPGGLSPVGRLAATGTLVLDGATVRRVRTS